VAHAHIGKGGLVRYNLDHLSGTTGRPTQQIAKLRDQAETLQDQLDERTEQLGERTEQLAANEELFRLLVASVRDYAIFMLDPKGYVATWNAGAQAIKGYTADEIIGRHFSVFYPPEDVAAGKTEMELEVAERDGRFEDLGWRVRKDGTKIWANVVISAMRDAAGTLIGFSKVTRDLTEQRRVELARRAAEDRFRLLVESVRDYALFALDPKGMVATWNAGAERIKGYTAAEIIGSHFSKFYSEEDVRAGKCEFELEVAEREGRFEDEGWRLRKDGTKFWANVVISAVRDDQGKLVGFSKITRDLTDRRRAEDERAARLAAEQANRSKDEFLAMLGHELRNPLAPIVTALELIKLRSETESKELQIIERQVSHMMRLVDDLLDVSRITRGKIELKLQRIDVHDVIVKALEMVAPLLEQKRHHVAMESTAGQAFVNGDENRLTQIITNLLTNSARYTPPGGNIVVKLRTDARGATVEVRDDGQGVDPELLPRIFDLFVQGNQTSERSSGGLGLGLTLVKSLAQQHGGRVTAHSPGRGHGSTFSVWLPLFTASTHDASAETPRQLPVALRPRRVVVVDDNEDARTLLCEILRAVGHDVKTAGDAFAALEVIADFAPDVAILDIGLPVVDGFELAERIRARLGRSAPRLIALSGYGQANDRERSKAAGFEVHLVKPVDAGKLLELLTVTPS
jgi:PAS domain S-box-containing protein